MNSSIITMNNPAFGKMAPRDFQRVLLNWFDQHGRKDLPWQKNKTPYRVWISEIMLQQTQVNTVMDYFQRFMARFPTLKSLAEASEDSVLHLWTGLGYYNRARNLHRTAKIIIETYHGQFPDEVEQLEKLPGIGRSTAGAIASIAFEKKAAILDGNVKRVLTRLEGIQDWPGEKKVTEALWLIAESYTPAQRTADYTQAIMDLGATVCVRGQPHCERCPLEKYCMAHAQGIEKRLPLSKPRKILPIRQTALLILQKKPHFVLLEKRPPTGVWGNLWSLPEISGSPSRKDILKICKQRFRLEAEYIKSGSEFKHTFSHFHLNITPIFAQAKKMSSKIMEADQQIWYNLHAPQALGLPAPVKSLLKMPHYEPSY